MITRFITESQHSVRAIKSATGCVRVNVASLSNRVSHIHLHLIPRFPENEEFPFHAPWRDRREQTELPSKEANLIMQKIMKNLA